MNRRELEPPIPIPDASLTPAARATLSNTICGDVAAARALERLGLLEIDRIEKRRGERLAFFHLTEAGEDHVRRHYVVADVPTARRNLGGF